MILPKSIYKACEIAETDRSFLQPTNARLLELKELYLSADRMLSESSRWDDAHLQTQLDWPYFRGDNAYVWQERDGNDHHAYRLTAAYTKQRDSLGLFGKLSEDGAFGVFTYEADDGHVVSRDLLDSINEILFLEEAINISSREELRILDIGAGYGRLAHRMAIGLPNLKSYVCIDAIAESAFLQEYYARFRNVEDKVKVMTLPEIGTGAVPNISLAINTHAFSECTLSAIAGWIDLLRRSAVQFIMIVPNGEISDGKVLLSTEIDGSRLPFESVLVSHGYVLIRKQPKYLDSDVQREGVTPTYHYLFERAKNPR